MQLLCTEENGKVPKYFTHPSIFRCGYPHLYKPLLVAVVVVVGEAYTKLGPASEQLYSISVYTGGDRGHLYVGYSSYYAAAMILDSWADF